MKKDLLEYLDEEKPAKGEDSKKDLGGESLEDMKAKLLAMKYESTHEPDKRADVLVSLIKCIVGKSGAVSKD